MLEATKAKSAPGLDKLTGATRPRRSTEWRAYIVGDCDQEIVSKRGIAETDKRSVIAAGRFNRHHGRLPADEIHVSTPATVATIAAAIGASSFTLITASAVTIDGIIRC